MFILKKKYEMLNKEFLSLNLENEKLKKELDAEKSIKEKFLGVYEDEIKVLESVNETYFLEIRQQENEIEILNQETKLYQETVEALEEEIEKLKKSNKKLIDLWNLTNKKLWVNKESVRQLRKLSKDIREADRIDKRYLADHLGEISMYINQGVDLELKTLEEVKGGN
jgi:predicted RNase H-like nuclease (RuvC/YqgF family)